MPSYTSYKRFMAVLDSDDSDIDAWITVNGNHIPIVKGQSKGEAIRNFISKKRQEWSQNGDGPQPLGNIMGELINNIKSGKQTFSSRAVETAVKKIHLPEAEAAKCAEQIIEYTRSPTRGDRELINKAIWNSDSYNGFTYSGIEAEYDRDYKVGDDVGGRLISWSKDWKVAAQFSNKLLFINKNPGMDISDFSAEPDEEEVLTATNMSFIVKDIKNINGYRVLEVEYKGKK